MSEARTPLGNLRVRALTSFLWAYGAFLSQKLLVFAATLVLARVLEPSEFGVVAFALGVMAYMWGLTDLGMTAALIQRPDAKEPGIASTVFWIGVVGSFVLVGISWVVAPYIADVGPSPMVEDVFRVLSAGFVLGALSGVPSALLQHSLEFKRLAAREIGAGLAKGGVSIVLALTGAGVWALVVGQLAGAVASVVLLWLALRWRPAFQIRRDALPSLLRFGSGLTALNFVAEAARNADYLIIGVRLGADPLGLYYMAFRLPELIVGSISQVAWTVLFPLYSRLRDAVVAVDGEDESAQLRRGYLTTVRLGSLVLFPLGFGIAALAEPIVDVLLGERWKGVAEPMALVAVWAALTGITGMPGTVFKSMGRMGLMTGNSLVYASVLLPALWFAAGSSIVWVAAAHLLVRIGSLLYIAPMAGRVLSIPWTATIVDIAPGAAVAAAMGAVVYGLAAALPAGAAVGVGVPVGALVYGALVRLFLPGDFARLRELLGLLAQRVGRRIR